MSFLTHMWHMACTSEHRNRTCEIIDAFNNMVASDRQKSSNEDYALQEKLRKEHRADLSDVTRVLSETVKLMGDHSARLEHSKEDRDRLSEEIDDTDDNSERRMDNHLVRQHEYPKNGKIRP